MDNSIIRLATSAYKADYASRGGGTPLYKPNWYVQPQKVWFLRPFRSENR